MKSKGSLIAGLSLAASSLFLAGLAWNYTSSDAQLRKSAIETERDALHRQIVDRVDAAFAAIQRQSAQQLLSFHQEGLGFQLTRWAESNSIIETPFQWTPNDGFTRNSLAPTTARSLENRFRNDPADSGDEARVIRHGSATELDWNTGYFEENLEDARYRGVRPEPIVVWLRTGNDETGQWICWHRIASDEPVRGFALVESRLVDALNQVARSVASERVSTRLLHFDSIPSNDEKNKHSPLANWDGRYVQLSIPDEAGEPTRASLLSYTLIIVCATLAILCGVLIAVQSDRKYREALRKTSFVSSVSHEFKTPITSIGIHADLLTRSHIEPGKRLRFATTIAQQCERLSRMVDNLLALNSLESGKPCYASETINLAAITREAIEECQPILRQAELDARLQSRNSPATLQSDPDALKRVLVNLLENAAKYAASGTRVDLEIKESEKNTTLVVTDDGPGIPKKHAQRVFEPFTQLDNSLSRKTGGSGIGLAIARGVVRDLGGELSLNTNYTQGASFIIEFKK